jgi:hypothetical protein
MDNVKTTEGLSPQTKLVLEYLTSGRELTGMIAMMTLGVVSLTSRVAELRKAGFKIDGKWSEDHFKRRYMKYWMEKSDGNR